MPIISVNDLIGFPFGLLAGLIFGWIAAKLLLSGRFSVLASENKAEIATLTENIRNKTSEIEQLKKGIDGYQSKIDTNQIIISDLQKKCTELETLFKKEREEVLHRESFATESRKNLMDTFTALSSSALKENNRSFMELALSSFSKYMDAARHDLNVKSIEVKEIVKPVRDALERYDKHVQIMELEREKAYGTLTQQIFALSEEQKNLQKETGKLVKALQEPHTRGRWGEITLKRVAELAGMTEKCDFFQQETAQSENGLMRPDMIVRLPGSRNIIVDAKVPLSAYLDAVETETDANRNLLLETHARHVQSHIQKLAQKTYWTQFKPTPEFVVLFIPGENFFSAALNKKPNLIEEGVEKGVIIATPTTLISLLKAVSYGWRQELASENAQAISELGHELYERLFLVSSHINKLGKDIEKCMHTYNQMVGSIEKRVFVSARKFENLGVTLKGNNKIGDFDPIMQKARQLDIQDDTDMILPISENADLNTE
ncbi:MAG: DNA recombination protein RmuC [Proteobacteria bacterium]|nr:DNA recombination protein RmuC [Pseudomonadota bacterium]